MNAESKSIKIGDIQQIVGDHFHIPMREMLSDCRAQNIARARQTAMYFSKRFTFRSLPEIGRRFRRDHTTVMHALRAVKDRIAKDPQYEANIEFLDQAIMSKYGFTPTLSLTLNKSFADIEDNMTNEIKFELNQARENISKLAEENPRGLIKALSSLTIAALLLVAVIQPAAAATTRTYCIYGDGAHDLVVRQLKEHYGETLDETHGIKSGGRFEFYKGQTGGWTVVYVDTEGTSCIIDSKIAPPLKPPPVDRAPLLPIPGLPEIRL